MTTLKLTPNDTTGSIALQIHKTKEIARVVRTNINGSEEVRFSTSQLPSPYVATTHTNMIPNPSFTVDTVGWGSDTGTPTLTSSTEQTYVGSRSLKAVSTTTSTDVAVYPQIALTAGVTYTMSWYVYSAFARRVSVDVQGGPSNVFITDIPAGVWTRVWGTWKQTTTATRNLYMHHRNGPVGPGGTIYIDGVQLEVSDEVTPAFNGSTSDDASGAYNWSGATNNSPSIRTYGGTLVVTDSEASNGLNSYNVYHTDGTFVSGSATLNITKPWISVPVMPQYSEQVETLTDFNSNREANTTVHRPLGRSDSLVVMGRLGDRTGSMEIFCKDYAAARKLERIFERGEVVQLRQTVPEMDLYFTATSIPVAPYSVVSEGATRWALQINYIEVRRPIGNLAGAFGWTFDELAESFVSYNQVLPAFTNYDNLTLGDAIV